MIFLFFLLLLVKWLFLYTPCVPGVSYAFNDISITYLKKKKLFQHMLSWNILSIVCLGLTMLALILHLEKKEGKGRRLLKLASFQHI